MDPVTIMVVASAAIQGISSFMGAQSKKKAAQEQAEAYRLEAAEYMRRSWINYRASRRQQGTKVAGVASAYSSSGIDLNSGSSVLAFETINEEYTRQLTYDIQMAKFNEQNILRKGTIMDTTARDISTASYLEALGNTAQLVGKWDSIKGDVSK